MEGFSGNSLVELDISTSLEVVVQKHWLRVFEQMDPWIEDQKQLRSYLLEAIRVLRDS